MSATAAAASATSSANSATAAAGSASTATTKAGEAATSATNAAGSVTIATTKATEAAAAATSAAGSADTATVQAANAASSATTAGNSATTATTKANEAAASAADAAASATALGSAILFRGAWDASGGVYPTAPVSPETVDQYRISVAGTMTGAQGSMTVKVGDYIQYDTALNLWYKTAAAVTKDDLGLGNVPNVDATNADNLASGTVPTARLNPILAAMVNATLGADKLIYFTGANTVATTALSAFNRGWLGYTNADDVCSAIGAQKENLRTSALYNCTPNPATYSIMMMNASGAVINNRAVAYAGLEFIALTSAAAMRSYLSAVSLDTLHENVIRTLDIGTLAQDLLHCEQLDDALAVLHLAGIQTNSNHIGVPGTRGFGVGICPSIPSGFSAMPGTSYPGSGEYGNYLYTDGSQCVWIPAFYIRIGHTGNDTYATYGVNSINIKALSDFADRAAAEAAGYFLPRAFINGGVVKPGFMIDKYECSKNGAIASSLANATPLNVSGSFDTLSSLNAEIPDSIEGVFAAAKTRGSQFFPVTRFMFVALAFLATAHAQASTSATYCAWYDPTKVNNLPKGCKELFEDPNDTSIIFQKTTYYSSYFMKATTGGAEPMDKTTHNGQHSGVADLCGNMGEVTPGGKVNLSATRTGTGTAANPAKITYTAHGRLTGDLISVDSSSSWGSYALANKIFRVTKVDDNNFTLDGVDGTAFTAGTFYYKDYSIYTLKESVDVAVLTGGNTLNTDYFGAVGLAANFEQIDLDLNPYPRNSWSLNLGYGANQVFASDASGVSYNRTNLGIPKADGAYDGTDLWGKDLVSLRSAYNASDTIMISGYSYDDYGIWHTCFDIDYDTEEYGFRCATY